MLIGVLSINKEDLGTSWNFRKLSVHGQALEHSTSSFHKPSKVAWFSLLIMEFRNDFLCGLHVNGFQTSVLGELIKIRVPDHISRESDSLSYL